MSDALCDCLVWWGVAQAYAKHGDCVAQRNQVSLVPLFPRNINIYLLLLSYCRHDVESVFALRGLRLWLQIP